MKKKKAGEQFGGYRTGEGGENQNLRVCRNAFRTMASEGGQTG